MQKLLYAILHKIATNEDKYLNTLGQPEPWLPLYH
jgi:hypothetical protein